MQNSARRPPTLGPSPQTWATGPPVGSYETTSTIAIINSLLLSPKADTHFTIPQRVEGWVDIDGRLYTQTVHLPIQVLTAGAVSINFVDQAWKYVAYTPLQTWTVLDMSYPVNLGLFLVIGARWHQKFAADSWLLMMMMMWSDAAGLADETAVVSVVTDIWVGRPL